MTDQPTKRRYIIFFNTETPPARVSLTEPDWADLAATWRKFMADTSHNTNPVYIHKAEHLAIDLRTITSIVLEGKTYAWNG